jgi:hypothetical protein
MMTITGIYMGNQGCIRCRKAYIKALFNRAGKFQITILNTRRTRRASAGAAGAPALRVTETSPIKKARLIYFFVF